MYFKAFLKAPAAVFMEPTYRGTRLEYFTVRVENGSLRGEVVANVPFCVLCVALRGAAGLLQRRGHPLLHDAHADLPAHRAAPQSLQVRTTAPRGCDGAGRGSLWWNVPVPRCACRVPPQSTLMSFHGLRLPR